MIRPAPADPAVPARWTTERYLALVESGVLGPDDRVELLEGVIVARAPQNVPHAAGVCRVEQALHRALGDRAGSRTREVAGTPTSRWRTGVTGSSPWRCPAS